MPLQEHACEELDCGEKGRLKAPVACRSTLTALQHDSSARVLPLLHIRPVSRVNERRDDTLCQLPRQRLNTGKRSGGLLEGTCLNHGLRRHPGAELSHSTPSFCCRGEALGCCIATKDAAPIFLWLVMAGAGRMIDQRCVVREITFVWGACLCSTLRPCQTLGRAAGSVTLMPSGLTCSSTFMLSDRACTLQRQPLCTLSCAHNWGLAVQPALSLSELRAHRRHARYSG